MLTFNRDVSIEMFPRFLFLFKKCKELYPNFSLEVTNFVSVKCKTELFRSLHLSLSCEGSTFFIFI